MLEEGISMVDTVTTASTIETVARFSEAFRRHDVDGIMAMMTDDCVFESMMPAPDGKRVEGQEEMRAFWTQMFEKTPTAHFETEDSFACGDRCTVMWRYSWNTDGVPGHVRGIDVFRVRDGKVSEKLSYAKR
jgi:ketosteroid isomerase-like protein